jgi:[ribosomal protein S5]-alanine N-acetyltransferase
MQPLKTDRLILRDFTPRDFEAFFATTIDPEYQQCYPESEANRAFYQDVFESILSASQQAERTKFQLAICLPEGELIGTCGVRIEDIDNHQASFGCAIGRRYWSKGYAYEASHSILNFGFSRLSIHRIYAETISENLQARRLAERLGMRHEAELKHTKYFRGRWWDSVIYAVLEDEWEQQVK